MSSGPSIDVERGETNIGCPHWTTWLGQTSTFYVFYVLFHFRSSTKARECWKDCHRKWNLLTRYQLKTLENECILKAVKFSKTSKLVFRLTLLVVAVQWTNTINCGAYEIEPCPKSQQWKSPSLARELVSVPSGGESTVTLVIKINWLTSILKNSQQNSIPCNITRPLRSGSDGPKSIDGKAALGAM